MDYDSIILGGGIAGLSSAHFFKKTGEHVLLLEKENRVGGMLYSKKVGDYQLDFGANSASLTPELEQLIIDLNLESELLVAEAVSKKRFLVSNNDFHAVEPNPFKILSSAFLSTKAKYQLFTESFRKRGELRVVRGENQKDASYLTTLNSPLTTEESVAEFITRRFGTEILEKVFDPVLSGIYAGDVQKLSMQQVMPALVNWEKEYGSVTRGLFKNVKTMKPRKIINFKGGFSTLINALQSELINEIQLDATIQKIEKLAFGYRITVKSAEGKISEYTTKNLISTLPSYALQSLSESFDKNLATILKTIEYTAMHVLHVGFLKKDIPRLPQGFGFLVPHIENRKFLGAINQSLIFPEKAPQEIALLTVFHKHNNTQAVIEDLQQLLKTNAQPVFQEHFFWQRALPQFNVGYETILNTVSEFEKENPNFLIRGNWRTGVAVGKNIESAFKE